MTTATEALRWAVLATWTVVLLGCGYRRGERDAKELEAIE